MQPLLYTLRRMLSGADRLYAPLFCRTRLLELCTIIIIVTFHGILRTRAYTRCAMKEKIIGFVFLQVSVRSEARRDFYLYADAWWKDYTSVSKELHKRYVVHKTLP